jgi:hypothetical protein
MLWAALAVAAANAQAATVHVKADATGANNGSSWVNAFTSLDSALAAAVPGDELWVAAGTYRPSRKADGTAPDPGEERLVTFQLREQIALYGGFAGTETTRNERNWTTHETILSGDIGTVGETSDNSHHVVRGVSRARLDGVTVKGGNAGDSFPAMGGGMLIDGCDSTLIVANCLFTLNQADDFGGGIGISASWPTVASCRFVSNSAGAGGAVAGDWNTGLVIMTECTFESNSSLGDGGAFCSYWSADARFTGCTFKWNTTTGSGGAIYNGGTTITTSCVFDDNTALSGGALGGGNSVQATSCIFSGNVARDGGAVISWDSLTATNCVFWKNRADRNGGGVSCMAVSIVVNCTFSGNVAALSGGAVYVDPQFGDLQARNSILWGNLAAIGEEATDQGWFACCDIRGCGGSGAGWNPAAGSDGGGNLDWDPLFVDPENGDLRLTAMSPCIDAADGDTALATDKDGLTRRDDPGMPNVGIGSPVFTDIGAYEFPGLTPAPWIHVELPEAHCHRRPVQELPFRWRTSPGVGQVMIELSRDGGATWPPEGTLAVVTDNDGAHTWTVTDGGLPLPQRNCRIRVADSLDPLIAGVSDNVMLYSGGLRVAANAAGPEHDGSSWANAFLDVQEALAIAQPGDEIWVAAGIYKPTAGTDRTISFALRSQVALYGGFAGTEEEVQLRDWRQHATVLSGDIGLPGTDADNSYHVVRGAAGATMDGFTVTAGNADGPAWVDHSGGGMLNDGTGMLTVANCRFFSNSADYDGSAMYNRYAGQTRISSCVFEANGARLGAAMTNYYSSPRITNCVFLRNGGIRCPAIYNYTASPTLVYCTFSANGSGPAVSNAYYSSPSLWSCILWDYQGSDEIVSDESSVANIGCSLVRGCGGSGAGWQNVLGEDWGGNLDSDPLFVTAGTDVRLRSGSPCLNAGEALVSPDSDVLGTPRPQGPAPDMGAYERLYADVALGDLAHTYDGTAKSATVATVPAGLAVGVTYDGAAAAPTNAGSYTVVATVNDANYEGTASGTLTITKVAATVTLSGLAHTYDGTAMSATVATVPAGLAVGVTYDGAAAAPTNAGSYTVVATVNDANYEGSAVGTMVINAPPVIESAATASPSTARIGAAVQFFVAATDVDGGALSCTWAFGDGSHATGAGVTHAYTAVGTYTATVTISDGRGGTATSAVTVTIQPAGGDIPGDTDTDGDGFSDTIELAAGSSATNASDRPVGLAPAGKTGVLSVTKLGIKLSFAKPASDAIGLSGLLLIPEGLSVAGQTVIVDVGGVVKTFTLDAKGKAKQSNDSFAAGVKAGKTGTPLQVAKFAMKLMKGDFDAALADEGLVSGTVETTVIVPVTVVFNGEVLKKAVTQTYRAKGEKGATK